MNEEQVIQPVEQPEPESTPQQESIKDQNWRAMRERATQAERRAYEAEQALAAAKAGTAPAEDDDIHLADSDLFEGHHYKKAEKKRSRETKALYTEIEQLKNMVNEQALRIQHPGFNDIVTDANLEKLAAIKPALYRSIMANQNLKDRGDVAVDAINMWVLPTKKHIVEDKRVEENKNKPKPAASVAPAASMSPLTNFGPNERITLSEEQKQEIRRRTAQYKKML